MLLRKLQLPHDRSPQTAIIELTMCQDRGERTIAAALSMLRIILFLIIVGGLTLFALQNISPVPLVILGTQTQALPLSVWILGAIAAGALTTLAFAVLFKASNAIAPSRPRSRAVPKRSSREQLPNQPPPKSWTSGWGNSSDESTGNPKTYSAYASPANAPNSTSPAATVNPRSASASGDDWERVGRSVEEWDDWGTPQSRSESTYASPYPANSPNYSTRFQDTRTVIQEPEERDREAWDDWEEGEDYGESDRDSSRDELSYPRRTDFEIPQQPRSSYRSGSVYSYSYRDNEEAVVDANTNLGQTTGEQNIQVDHNQSQASGVYDAEYRLITPPYDPDPEVTPALADEDDWGFEEDELDDDPLRPTKRQI
jgi:uncharacterized integral membrane protein